MTEDEAKTKWCPMVRYQYHSNDPAANRWKEEGGNATNPIACRCIASECMMWRWVRHMVNEAEYDQQRNSMMSMTPVKPEYADSEHGYCGLAGEP